MRNLKKALLARIAVGVMGLGTAGTAAAATTDAPSNCRSGALCGYFLNDYSDAHVDVFNRVADLRTMRRPFGGTWDNQIFSAFNQGTQCGAFLYQGYNFQGAVWGMARGTGNPHLSLHGFGNNISSIRFCTR
jgi:hypothetical protein